jgi:DNA-binding CsgD family transcriptional regulator
MSLAITGSVLAGYLLGGASPGDVVTGPYRYSALSLAVLPLLTGVVGVLLACVTNSVFSRLAQTVAEVRCGFAASTPAMAALLSGRPARALCAAPSGSPDAASSVALLTNAEREVVALLVAGHLPKQIARLRGVALETVRSQIKTSKRKTGARTINDLVSRAWDVGQ